MLKFWLILVFLGSTLTFGCETVTTDGEYLGLTIGQSKEEVLEILKAKPNVSRVSLRPYKTLVIDKESIAEINHFLTAEAIDITGPFYNAQLEFDKDVVSALYLAPINKGVAFDLALGQSKKKALSIITVLLLNCQKCRAHNFVPGQPHFDLDQLSKEQRSEILSYDSWAFSESDEFSHMELFFKQNTLERMEYLWSPIELP